MEKLNLCVVGAAGRLGLCVLKSLAQPEYADNINLVGAIVSNQSPYKNRPIVSEIGLKSSLVFSDELSAYIKQADVILDCSSPESSMHTLELAKSAHKKLILCATGFSPSQLENIKQTAQAIPIVFAPNTSIGLNLTNAVTKLLCTKIPQNTDIQIIETHHVHKKDAPSGAAKQLANTVCDLTNIEPVVTSMRVGETVGEHTVLFTLNGEQVQLTHKAFDRSIFALGALRAATWVNQATQPAFYTMDDVLLLNGR